RLVDHARAAAAAGLGTGSVAAPATARSSRGPNITFGVVMTYDAHDGYVVAVSLNDSAGPFNNTYGPNELTWKFAGGSWSQMSTVGHVPATLAPGLVYDARDGYVLLYGGRLMGTNSSIAPVTNQTWSFQAGVWANLSANNTAAPFAVDFPNLVYDSLDEYVLLYDEVGILASNGSETLQSTWSYAAGIWTNLTQTAGTPPALYGAMAYDPLDKCVVYFGGYTLANQLVNSTFTFAGGKWTNATGSVTGGAPGRMSYGMAYDGALQRVVVYGGLVQAPIVNLSGYSNATWGYSGGNWTLLSSTGSAYFLQSMVWDAADNETLLLGSSNFTASPPNVVTWVFSQGVWTVGAPALAPSVRVADTGQTFTVHVTESPNGGALTYRYTGLPSGCLTVDSPTVSCSTSVAATYSIAVLVRGAGGFSASASTSIVVNPAPGVVRFVPTAPVGEVGVPSAFELNATPGSGGLTYSYLGLPPGCLSSDTAQLRCSPTIAGTYDITANITDVAGVSALGTLSFLVVPSLAISSLAANRTVLDVGEPLSVQTVLAGGAGPFLYQYEGLPSGCASLNASSFACHPTTPGTYAVGLVATDTLGAFVRGSAGFSVNPLPAFESLGFSGATISAGGSIAITETLLGGTAPFEYRYSGLPPGCEGGSVANITCSNVPAGTFTVSVTVVDATKAAVTASGTFQAHGPGAPHSGLQSLNGAFGVSGFLSGLAAGAIVIGLVGLERAYRLRLARQGREILNDLRVDHVPTADEPSDGAHPIRNERTESR
ncbi:MAG TPA: hypothetical protein VJQ43_00320, partial [Thermoplasmata archaeon]|nr:hypothetical protein [Thermoplasmata archaeon]